MAVSQQNRERFQQIGRDRLALALASGTLQSIGITENNKPDAIAKASQSAQDQALACVIPGRRFVITVNELEAPRLLSIVQK
jgi:hypothetical protein